MSVQVRGWRYRVWIAALIVIVALVGISSNYLTNSEPKEFCSARLNATNLKYPCVWGGRTFDYQFDQKESRLELRPFSIDGQIHSDRDSEYAVTVWYMARTELVRGNIFATFGLTKDFFDNLSSAQASVDLPSRFDSPKPRTYRLTFKRDGDDWLVQTFYHYSFEPLPDGMAMDAVTESWYVRFEAGDINVPSFSLLCRSFAPNCEMQLKEKGFSTVAFVSKALIADRQRIAAALRAITKAILNGELSPTADRNPCIAIQVCLSKQ